MTINPLWPSSGNGLLPDCTKPLPEPMLTYHQWGSVTTIWGQFHEKYFSHQQLKLASKSFIQNFNIPNLPGANELKPPGILRPERDGRHLAEEIFTGILSEENFCILIQILLKFVHLDSIDIKSALVQVMAWVQIGYKPLPEAMLTIIHTLYSISRLQWVKLPSYHLKNISS